MTSEQTLESTELDVVIVGGGVGGLYALYHLRGLGYRVRVYERVEMSEVPGTGIAILVVDAISIALSTHIPLTRN